ncbi:anhydro-N-acetylmuramic acid kinase [Aureimonas fodinaquatilis]
MSVWAIGLMTGTALDGNIDVAMLRTDGETIDSFGPQSLEPYSTDIGPLLADAVAMAREWNFAGPEPELFARAQAALTREQANAVNAVLARHHIDPAEIAVIGFHGQTVLHRAPASGIKGATRQLGDGALMARMTGICTAYDFRTADIASCGQGAPLAPIYHRALLRWLGAGQETAILNLGGVANISWCDSAGTVHGFDTGPANAPLDDWMRLHTGAAMDRDGVLAAAGTVDEGRLAVLLSHPYLTADYPKSLDRNDFTSGMAEGCNLQDGAALLTAFTAASVGAGLDRLPSRPDHLIVCGGGRRNPTLMRQLQIRACVEIVDADDVGLRGDAIEAECFAFLAVRCLKSLPISFPMTTGVAAPLAGGKLAQP